VISERDVGNVDHQSAAIDIRGDARLEPGRVECPDGKHLIVEWFLVGDVERPVRIGEAETQRARVVIRCVDNFK
jgi:hypothetical protein